MREDEQLRIGLAAQEAEFAREFNREWEAARKSRNKRAEKQRYPFGKTRQAKAFARASQIREALDI